MSEQPVPDKADEETHDRAEHKDGAAGHSHESAGLFGEKSELIFALLAGAFARLRS